MYQVLAVEVVREGSWLAVEAAHIQDKDVVLASRKPAHPHGTRAPSLASAPVTAPVEVSDVWCPTSTLSDRPAGQR